MRTHTHTYAVLEISAAAYHDVRGRLVEAAGKVDFKDTYQGEEDGVELLVLGTVALKAVKIEPESAMDPLVYDQAKMRRDHPMAPVVEAIGALTEAVLQVEMQIRGHG